MGKQNAVMKSWVEFVKKTRRDMSKKGKKVSYKDAMKEASRRKKQWKRGGAATIPAAATSTGGAATIPAAATSHFTNSAATIPAAATSTGGAATIPAAATSHFTNSAATIPAAATSTGGKKTRRHRRKGGAATIGGRRHIRKTRKHRRHSRKH